MSSPVPTSAPSRPRGFATPPPPLPPLPPLPPPPAPTFGAAKTTSDDNTFELAPNARARRLGEVFVLRSASWRRARPSGCERPAGPRARGPCRVGPCAARAARAICIIFGRPPPQQLRPLRRLQRALESQFIFKFSTLPPAGGRPLLASRLALAGRPASRPNTIEFNLHPSCSFITIALASCWLERLFESSGRAPRASRTRAHSAAAHFSSSSRSHPYATTSGRARANARPPICWAQPADQHNKPGQWSRRPRSRGKGCPLLFGSLLAAGRLRRLAPAWWACQGRGPGLVRARLRPGKAGRAPAL